MAQTIFEAPSFLSDAQLRVIALEKAAETLSAEWGTKPENVVKAAETYYEFLSRDV